MDVLFLISNFYFIFFNSSSAPRFVCEEIYRRVLMCIYMKMERYAQRQQPHPTKLSQFRSHSINAERNFLFFLLCSFVSYIRFVLFEIAIFDVLEQRKKSNTNQTNTRIEKKNAHRRDLMIVLFILFFSFISSSPFFFLLHSASCMRLRTLALATLTECVHKPVNEKTIFLKSNQIFLLSFLLFLLSVAIAWQWMICTRNDTHIWSMTMIIWWKVCWFAVFSFIRICLSLFTRHSGNFGYCVARTVCRCREIAEPILLGSENALALVNLDLEQQQQIN